MRLAATVLVAVGVVIGAAAVRAEAPPTAGISDDLANKIKGLNDDLLKKVKDALPEKAAVAPAKPRRLLVYSRANGFYHGTIPLGAKMLELMGEKTGAFTAVIADDPAMIAPEQLQGFDAIFMNNTSGNCFMLKGAKEAVAKDMAEMPAPEPGTQRVVLWTVAQAMEKAAQQALLDFVKGGKGLGGNHAATDCYYGWKEYGEMIGAYFAGHPYGRIHVRNDDPASPVNAAFGGQGFPFSDEIYVFKDPYSRQRLRVLLSIDNEKSGIDPAKGRRQDGDYALSWIQSYGQGRVFYCAFGHQTHVFHTPTILRHFLDGIQFILGDLKADITPSAKAGK